MSENKNLERTGNCLCSAVRFKAKLKSTHLGVCHCSICRKWGGGPSIAAECERDFGIANGAEYVKWYKSSDWAERAFCSQCGSNLFVRVNEDVADYCGVFPALLDNEEGLSVREHIYTDCKPPYYDFADDCKQLTEAEFLAMFAEKPSDE